MDAARAAHTTAFWVGHATHPDWRAALALAAAQVNGQIGSQTGSSKAAPGAAAPTLGLVYFTDHYAAHADALVAELQARWPGVAWAGCAAVGVAAGGVEYMDEPALALMLGSLPADDFELFSGARKLQRIKPFSALVHADPSTPDLADLIAEMSARTDSGYLFGGLVSSRASGQHVSGGVLRGGLSGVAFAQRVALVSRVTQGCQPVGPTRKITACDRNVITELDGQPALNCLLADLGLADLSDTRGAVNRLRGTLVGLTDAAHTALAIPGKVSGQFGTDTRVRHLVGLDPGRQAVAVAELVQPGMRAAFCQRDVQAARRDLVRVCSEIRDEVEQALADSPVRPAPSIRGAVYVSCTGRGGAHFGGPSAELQIVQHALGDVPLVGFFAAGEIARHHLYGYTGVLTVFTGAA